MSFITKKTCFFVTCGNEWAKELTFSKTGWLFPSKTVPKHSHTAHQESKFHISLDSSLQWKGLLHSVPMTLTLHSTCHGST